MGKCAMLLSGQQTYSGFPSSPCYHSSAGLLETSKLLAKSFHECRAHMR